LENGFLIVFSGWLLMGGDEAARIAATALVHGVTVVTRNTADFVRTEVRGINPWEQH
jgi:predicted nucleic acid-binding protein